MTHLRRCSLKTHLASPVPYNCSLADLTNLSGLTWLQFRADSPSADALSIMTVATEKFIDWLIDCHWIKSTSQDACLLHQSLTFIEVHWLIDRVIVTVNHVNKSKCMPTSSISRVRSSLIPTWQANPRTLRPCFFKFSTAESTCFCLRLLTTTCAPSWPSRSAIAKPILKK